MSTKENASFDVFPDEWSKKNPLIQIPWEKGKLCRAGGEACLLELFLGFFAKVIRCFTLILGVVIANFRRFCAFVVLIFQVKKRAK